MKMGRKELPKELRKSERLLVFLTPDEMRTAKANAKASGEDIRDYVRRVIVAPSGSTSA